MANPMVCETVVHAKSSSRSVTTIFGIDGVDHTPHTAVVAIRVVEAAPQKGFTKSACVQGVIPPSISCVVTVHQLHRR